MSEAKKFVTGGPIDPDKQIYIERPEDTEILQAVRNEDYVTLLGARQTGKTSLLYKLARELKTEIPVYVNLTPFSGVKKDDWYDRVAKTVVRHLPKELRDAIGEVSFCTDPEQFRNLLWEIADASAGTDRLVFLLDEVGTVPKDIRDDFFGAIRTIFNDRVFNEAFQKYIFVLSGATPPTELVTRIEDSPFNISRTIYMSNFSIEGVRELGENLRLYGFMIDDSVIEHIYDWTHGHPNLTQEIFARLVQAKPGEVTKKMVDDSVDELVVKGCNNLNHIQRHVKDETVNQQVLGILNGELEIPFSLSNPEALNLYLIGVIGEGAEGKCVIRNKVYERILRPIEWKVESRSLIMKIISDSRIYVPLIAISRIDPESRTIERIKKEIDKLIDSLESKIPDIKSIVPSEQKQLYLALEELEKLGIICKAGKQYTLTEVGRKVIMEI